MQTKPLTKTQRLLKSFAAVQLLPEHYNYGDQTPALRDFGVAPSVATALIRWGEPLVLVCWFENSAGRSNRAFSWKPEFLVAAVLKHLELFGVEGAADLPDRLLAYAAANGKRCQWTDLSEEEVQQVAAFVQRHAGPLY